MAKIKPLYDKILVERLKAEEKTAGGIVLPDTAKEKPTEGRVVATGDGRVADDGNTIPPSVTVGDRILFGSYAGTEIKSEGKEYMILDESEILAIVDDKPWGKPAKAKKKKAPKKGKK
jgi:chaperonin GroES